LKIIGRQYTLWNQRYHLNINIQKIKVKKIYPQGSGMTNVSYTYDSTADGNYGKGQRTGMIDASGTTSYKYDARGRLVEEKKTIDSVDYVTSYTYDGADRIDTIIYPTGEEVDQDYNDRGLPDYLSGEDAGEVVSSALYNALGAMVELNLGNEAQTTYGYYGTGGDYDTTGGYYGRLWEIKTTSEPSGGGGGLEGWDNCMQITIDHTKVDDTLTQFPVLIHLSNDCGISSADMTAVFDEVGSNSKKIAVTEDDGTTQMYVEIEKWNYTGNSATNQAWLWVSNPGWTVSSTEDTVLYLYYDNTQADNTTYVGDTGSAPAQAVWDSNYQAVYHMTDGADTSHVYDSTSNANHGAKRGANTPLQADGLAGKGQQFTSRTNDSDYIQVTNDASLQIGGPFTVETLIKRTDNSANILITKYIGWLGGQGIYNYYMFNYSNLTNFSFGDTAYTDHSVQSGAPAYNDYTLLTMTWDGDYLKSYADASQTDSSQEGAVTPASSTALDLFLGSHNSAYTSGLDGVMDETRISSTSRSAAWIKATYYTTRDNLVSLAPYEGGGGGGGEPWLSGWDNRVEITIDHTKVDDTLTQFPVLLKLSSDSGIGGYDLTDIFTELGANSKKIAVTQDDGTTQMYLEIEKWDNTNNLAWLWVSQPGWIISNTTDTTLYLYYDNTQADNTTYVGDVNSTPAASVWDSSFRAVYHMNDLTTSSLADSKNSYDLNKRAANEPAQVDGQVGTGQDYDASNDKASYGSDFIGTVPLTVEALIYPAGWGENSNGRIVHTSKVSFYLRQASTALAFTSDDAAHIALSAAGSIQVANPTWYEVAATRDASGTANIYIDGSLSGTANQNSGTPATGYDFVIGDRGLEDRVFDGVIDEVRISTVVRSTAWIEATNYTLQDNLVSYSASSPGGSGGSTLQDIQYTWDAAGNLTDRDTLLAEDTWENEDFSYDFLDRLLTATGDDTSNPYSLSYSYDTIGNIDYVTDVLQSTTRDYSYNTNHIRPHAVTSITNPSVSYTYDENGNMNVGTARTWDVENRLTSITKDGVTTTFIYNGDGNRVEKTVGEVTTLYINQYYEKNLDSGEVTTYYYLGGKMVAQRKDTTLSYIHQDSLGSSSAASNADGSSEGSIRYLPFGLARSGMDTLSDDTDKLFTGQRLDFTTDLYYYGARYYNPEIGRFISADTIVPDPMNPQTLNRYSYCLNNPFKYTDPTGHSMFDDYYLYVANGGNVEPPSMFNSNQISNPPLPIAPDPEPTIPLFGDSFGETLMNFFYFIPRSIEATINEVRAATGEPPIGQEKPIDPPSLEDGLPSPLDPYMVNTMLPLVAGVSGPGPTAAGLINEFSKIPKPAGLGSSIRAGESHAAKTLNEQLAMQQVASNPAAGKVIIKSCGDPRWTGWEKRQQIINGINVHYTYNPITKVFDDLKIVGP
jgi:RHS repeat-associated protein